LPGDPPIIAPYYDARLDGPPVRVKLFYDPADAQDPYWGQLPPPESAPPTATPSPEPVTATPTAGDTPEGTTTPGGTVTPDGTGTVEATQETPTATQGGTAVTATATEDTGSGTPTSTPQGTITVPPTATESATPTPSSTPTATLDPGGPPDNVQCELNPIWFDNLHLIIYWDDHSTFESEWVIEVSDNDGPWTLLDVTPTTNMPGREETEAYEYPGAFEAGHTYRFRIKGRNPDLGMETEFSDPSEGCLTPGTVASADDSCIEGQLYLQGRVDHSGMPIELDGQAVTTTQPDGWYGVCGLVPGRHAVTSGGGGFLRTGPTTVELGAGRVVTVPPVELRGGDVTRDDGVSLADLVLTGAAFGADGPPAAAADSTGDGQVDIFDLVLVASNYGTTGPLPWQSAAAVASSSIGQVDGRVDLARRRWVGPADGAPIVLAQRRIDDETLAVDVIARGQTALYAADVSLAFDASLLRVIDASERPGVQVRPGAMWLPEDVAFVAVNDVEGQAGEMHFAASRLGPAAALRGDQVLLTVMFRLRGDAELDASESVALRSVELREASGSAIPVRFFGIAQRSHGDLFIPIASVVR